MQLPFSHEAFLGVFAAYNSALWPAALALWVATAWLVAIWLRHGVSTRVLLVLLAVHWVWSGIAYHLLYFRSINPAATIFGTLFVLQGAVFAWLSAGGRARVRVAAKRRGIIGAGLVVCGLVYPVAALVSGLRYPRMPLFGVPCPTTLITAGLLLAALQLPRGVSVVPLIWALVGGSAALVLGIRPDLMLIVAATLLAVDLLAPRALGPGAPKAP